MSQILLELVGLTLWDSVYILFWLCSSAHSMVLMLSFRVYLDQDTYIFKDLYTEIRIRNVTKAGSLGSR